jgi:GT2 family glycosyltransferase
VERVAVVIVNRNAGALLSEALEHLSRQTLAPVRTVVVDNASTDGSLDGLGEGVEVIRLESNEGFARANNVAVSRVDDCDWVALLNPDAFPEPAWLEELVRAAREHPEYAFFGSRLVDHGTPTLLDGTGDQYHVSGWAWQRDHGRPRADVDETTAQEIFGPSAAAALYRRDAFLEVGGFDERYFCYYEDVDLAFRLRLAGHRCLYVPSSAVRHVGAAIAGRESDFAVYHAHRNLVWTYVKNMPGPLVWLYLPHHLAVNLLTLVWFSLRGHPGAIARAKVDAVRSLPDYVRARRTIQRTRTRSPRELRNAMARGLSGYLSAFRLARQA